RGHGHARLCLPLRPFRPATGELGHLPRHHRLHRTLRILLTLMSATAIEPLRQKWSGTLTDRARFRRQLNRQPVDRCFNMEFGYWDDNFKLWPMFRDHGITN